MIDLVVSSGRTRWRCRRSSSASRGDEARAFLEAEPYGFRVTSPSEETAEVTAGLVIRTNPPAGTLVDKGGQVTLIVSSGAPSAEVPNVVGQTEPPPAGPPSPTSA